MRLNRKSIIFRISLLYVIVTLLNVSVFVLLVFENQLDLIADNAILSSQHTGAGEAPRKCWCQIASRLLNKFCYFLQIERYNTQTHIALEGFPSLPKAAF